MSAADVLHGDEDYVELTEAEIDRLRAEEALRLRESDWLLSFELIEACRELDSKGFIVEHSHDVIEIWDVDPHGRDYSLLSLTRTDVTHDAAAAMLWALALGEAAGAAA